MGEWKESTEGDLGLAYKIKTLFKENKWKNVIKFRNEQKEM